MKVFHMPAAKATQVMLDVHKKGAGICGTFTYDIAVTKVEEVHVLAKEKHFVKNNLGANFRAELFDADLVARRNSVLLAACFNHCIHINCPPSAACQAVLRL